MKPVTSRAKRLLWTAASCFPSHRRLCSDSPLAGVPTGVTLLVVDRGGARFAVDVRLFTGSDIGVVRGHGDPAVVALFQNQGEDSLSVTSRFAGRADLACPIPFDPPSTRLHSSHVATA